MSDWTAHDDGSGKTYYYNATTGETSWEAPAGFGGGGGGGGGASSAWQLVNDPGSGRDYYYNSATGETSWDVPADYAGGGGGGADAAGGRSSSDYRRATVSRRSGIVKRSTARPQTVGERLATRAQKFIHMRKAEKGKLQPSAFAKRKSGGGATAAVTARPPSAPGARSESSPWQAVSDPSSGGTYYYNSVTGETSWDVPAGF